MQPHPRTIRPASPHATLLAAAIATLVAITTALGLPARAQASHGPHVAAWHVPWDAAAGTRTIQGAGQEIDEVSPFALELVGRGRIRRMPGARPNALLGPARRQGMLVIPTIGNEFDPDRVSWVLATPQRRRAHAIALTRLVVRNGWDGIDVDYENLHVSDRRRYVLLLDELARRLHHRGRILSVSVLARTDRFASRGARATDHRAIGRIADQVRVMAYDYHWRGGPPGPVAPRWWVEEVLDYMLGTARIPPRKVYLGVPLYGYHWVQGRPTASVTWRQARTRARRAGVPIRWSARHGSHWFTVQRGGRRHTVWFETHRATRIRARIARERGLGGLAMWRLGGEDPRTFPVAARELQRG